MSGLPTPPRGTEWRRADEIKVGDVVHGTMRGRVTSAERKPKTIWLTIEPAEEHPLMSVFGIEPRANIRPRHEDYIAVVL